MKKNSIIASAVAATALVVLAAAIPSDTVITKDAGATIVNTTELTKKIRGYKSATPVKITIQKNRVVKIEALKNRETPQYFAKAKAVLNSFEGKTVTKAAKMDVDAVTGATLSSKALVENVRTGLKYYKDHK